MEPVPHLGGLTWRRFTKEDWYGFAGATSFANGEPPLINDMITVDTDNGTILVSGEAPGFVYIVTGPDYDEVWHITGPDALNFLFHIQGPALTRAMIQACGGIRVL